ncbi:uncharacterized protein K452DRAFT_326606 [Aplosporella prunicola CBS 121167]|uniref:RING-type domain-containing protein n=1 Tax=Aplosporella prunicola CBS 121167 TaxID=1176127 RepID=A0A6A6BDF2_9PEZI|nr:uncharacterized protein K452DRAFT_326606 [Aplosporella prunicola CBS 121167]KAF2142076.1 hypothetical protein K452DRAFT_326606 [Aplosporella prunicola CBS 121167]
MTPHKPVAASATKNQHGAAASRPAAKLLDTERATRTGSKDSLRSKQPKKLDDTPKPDKNEELLKTFRSDLDSLRSLVTCKICDRLLYEPYVISCGHTYCYSCLCTWFVNNRSRKTCPDCRATVVQPPAPAYLVREMASVFINRAELLPPGETLEQHKKWQQEEADAVQLDKNNDDIRTGGLFRGCFSRWLDPKLRVIRDEEDGVDRCPICSWELEDGECAQCGLQFDDSGDLAWGNSFNGFSDMDETSEHDTLSEDLDADIDLEDPEAILDLDGYDHGTEDWQDQSEDYEQEYTVRRWLHNDAIAREQPAFRIVRPAAHSAAGSRRRSYSASIVSNVHTEDTEMDILEEENEDEDDGDSSMNDFIDDDELETASQSTQSIQSQTPTPPSNFRARRRRVVGTESPSTASSQHDDDDENDDEEGPIPAGRRRPPYRTLLQARSTNRRRVAPSETTEEASSVDQDFGSSSVDQDFEEDTQALLYQEGWSPLGHDAPDDEMDEDDDDDSDGGSTTVGWEPTTNSIERSRIGGSLTPTADRPNAAIRPPSRVGNSRLPDGSRGLRRRSSVLSAVSSANYEDGEADDDDSDIDRDGDSSMRSPTIRPRGSRLRLRDVAPANNGRPPTRNTQFTNSTVDPDTDENSDDTMAPGARRRPRIHRQEYDPRISWAFAQHMADIRDLNLQRGDILNPLDQLRGTTPISRPRTANRNRHSGMLAPAFSPLSNGPLPPFSPPANAPARLRTPLDQSPASGASSMSPRSGRTSSSAAQSSNPSAEGTNVGPRRAPTSPNGNGAISSTITSTAHMEHGTSQQNRAPASDVVDRPGSRVSSRPPSAAGRRNSGAFSTGYQVPMSPGLNFAARFQAQQTRNPWNPFIPANPRPRPSTQRLRDQSSTATLRPRNSQRGLRQQPSQANMRDVTPVQHIRQQSSRVNLRPQPSHNRLSSQASTRTLRGNSVPVMQPSPVVGPSVSPVGSARSRLTEEERLSRARELISSRQQALGAGTNPFAAGRSRQGPTQNSGVAGGAARGQFDATNVQSVSGLSTSSSHSASSQNVSSAAQNASPGLGRRRSNRNIGAPPGAFAPSPTSPSSGFIRTRNGSAGISPFPARDRTVVYSNEIAAGGSNLQY